METVSPSLRRTGRPFPSCEGNQNINIPENMDTAKTKTIRTKRLTDFEVETIVNT